MGNLLSTHRRLPDGHASLEGNDAGYGADMDVVITDFFVLVKCGLHFRSDGRILLLQFERLDQHGLPGFPRPHRADASIGSLGAYFERTRECRSSDPKRLTLN